MLKRIHKKIKGKFDEPNIDIYLKKNFQQFKFIKNQNYVGRPKFIISKANRSKIEYFNNRINHLDDEER